jgi:hypothetical protein
MLSVAIELKCHSLCNLELNPSHVHLALRVVYENLCVSYFIVKEHIFIEPH